MFTPQQIEQISFGKQTFGGYDIDAVDAFLEPLTEDYVTLYKENAILKSKMRVLVGKLEEYRKNEASMKEAIANAQKTCDQMVKDTEEKCRQMLTDASATAAENSRNASALIVDENERVEEARRAAAVKIDELEAQLNAVIQALERIKEANRPLPPKEAKAVAYDYDKEPDIPVQDPADAVADEISQNLEALVGTTDETAPKPKPRHPADSNTTGRFKGKELRFGTQYDSN